MKIIDQYILKRYLLTFVTMILLFIPIGVMVDLSDKVDKIIMNEASTMAIINYYFNFTIYFANLLFPIFLFLSVIWFTSKLASNTEIIAILSSGVSLARFLRPYLLGASVLAVLIFVMGMFIVPKASKGYNEFKYRYIYKADKIQEKNNIYNQIGENDFIYVSRFNPERNIGYNFTYEHFENENRLDFKITANSIRWVAKDSVFRLTSYTKRNIGKDGDRVITGNRLDTIFPFKLRDLSAVSYEAETKNIFELNDFIKNQERRGSSHTGRFYLVKYKRWLLPLTVFILTIIAVAVSAIKRRGGMGINLAFGIVVAFVYVFFDKIFGTMAQQSGFPPFLAVLLPNIIFGILAIYLLIRAKR